MGAAMIPLMGQQAPPPTPIPSGEQIQNSLATLAGNQQIAAQQAIKAQSDQLDLEQKKRYLDDSNTFVSAIAANHGDVDKSLQDIIQKVSPLSYQQFYTQNLAHKKDMAAIGKDQLPVMQDQLNRLGDLHDKAVKMDPDEYAQSWPEIAAQANNINPQLALDPNKPIPQAQLEAHGVTQHTTQWYVEQELKNRQAQEAAAKATETTQKTTEGALTNLASSLANAGSEQDWQARLDFARKQKVDPGILSQFAEHYSPEAVAQAKAAAIGPAEQAKITAQMPEEKIHVQDYLAAHNLPNTPANRLAAEKDYAQMRPLATIVAQNAAAGPALSDQALDNAAENYWAKGTLPPGGRSAVAIAQNRKIMDRAAQLHAGESITEGSAAYKANAESLKKAQTQFDQVSQFENTALKNLDQVAITGAKVPDLGARFANVPVRMISSQMLGTPEMAAFRTALLTAQTESAKILSSSNASGVLSDSARHEAQAVLDGNLPFPAMMASINQLKTDFGNRHQSMIEQIGDIQKRLGGKSTGNTSQSSPAATKTLSLAAIQKAAKDHGVSVDEATRQAKAAGYTIQ